MRSRTDYSNKTGIFSDVHFFCMKDRLEHLIGNAMNVVLKETITNILALCMVRYQSK